MNIGITLKPNMMRDFGTLIPNLQVWLSRRKHHLIFLEKEQTRINAFFKGSVPKNISYMAGKSFYQSCDLHVSLGGDGTLIGLCRKLNSKSAPVLGINMGKLGFITEFKKSDFYDALSDALAKNLRTFNIPLYQVNVMRKSKKVFSSRFINDTVLNRPNISRIFELQVETENEIIKEIAGDGLIITGPIGSTAYSLAAGGPIIHPHVKAFGLTPICPHGLTHRPLVISDDEVIKVKLTDENTPLSVTLDGQETFTAEAGDTLIVRKSKNQKVLLYKNPNRSYFKTLREKFTYGA